MSLLLRGVPVHPNEHSIKRGANFFKVIELLTQLKQCFVTLRVTLVECVLILIDNLLTLEYDVP